MAQFLNYLTILHQFWLLFSNQIFGTNIQAVICQQSLQNLIVYLEQPIEFYYFLPSVLNIKTERWRIAKMELDEDIKSKHLKVSGSGVKQTLCIFERPVPLAGMLYP